MSLALIAFSFTLSSAVHLVEQRLVAQDNLAGGNELDHGTLGKLAERTGYRLDGEAKIIGDILARHGKLDCTIAGQPLSHFEKKGRQPLLSALDQKQAVAAGPLELGDDDGEQPRADSVVTLRKFEQAAALDQEKRAIA